MKPSSMEQKGNDQRGYEVTSADAGPAKGPKPDDEKAETPPTPARRGRVGETLDLIRANPTGKIVLRVSIAIAGLAVVALGILLIPLPGPGWFIVIGGLAIWAVEFAWARSLLHFTRRNVRAWTSWIGRQVLPLRLVIGAVGLVFVGLVVWLSLKYSVGIDLVVETRNFLGR